MKTIEEWKTTLRAALREAMRARQLSAMSALREVLASIENAEAPAQSVAPPTQDAVFAGSVRGLGAGEVPRLSLTPEQVDALIKREIEEQRGAAKQYESLGASEQARLLLEQAALLVSLL